MALRLRQPLVGAAEGADQALVQQRRGIQGGVGTGGEEGFGDRTLALALQLEDDPSLGHRTRRRRASPLTRLT